MSPNHFPLSSGTTDVNHHETPILTPIQKPLGHDISLLAKERIEGTSRVSTSNGEHVHRQANPLYSRRRSSPNKVHRIILGNLSQRAQEVYNSIRPGMILSTEQQVSKRAYELMKGILANKSESLEVIDKLRSLYQSKIAGKGEMAKEDVDLYYALGEVSEEETTDKIRSQVLMERLKEINQKNDAIEPYWKKLLESRLNSKSDNAKVISAEMALQNRKIYCIQKQLRTLTRPDAELLLNDLDSIVNKKALMIFYSMNDDK